MNHIDLCGTIILPKPIEKSNTKGHIFAVPSGERLIFFAKNRDRISQGCLRIGGKPLVEIIVPWIRNINAIMYNYSLNTE